MGVLPGKEHKGTFWKCMKCSLSSPGWFWCVNTHVKIHWAMHLWSVRFLHITMWMVQFNFTKENNQDPLSRFPQSGEAHVSSAKLKWRHFGVPSGETLTWQTTTSSKGNWTDSILSRNDILQVWFSLRTQRDSKGAVKKDGWTSCCFLSQDIFLMK